MSFKKWINPEKEQRDNKIRNFQNSEEAHEQLQRKRFNSFKQKGPMIDDPDLPFGDGSDKIFGMENFGYTCYCNSIVQCLYYTTEFRKEILRYPKRSISREQKLKMPGLKPHAVTTFNQNQQQQQQPQIEHPSKNLMRKRSNFFGLGKKSQEEDTADDTNEQQQIQDLLTKIIIGDPAETTIDGRKKSAILKGPILNVDHSLNDYGVEESLYSALKDLFESMVENESKKGVVSPSFFIETLKRENELFRSTMHQDAHEFLNFLLNDVIDTANKHLKEERNGISDIFEGVLTNQTKCLTCETITNRNEKFLDLSIDLTNNDTLEKCLEQFSAKEMLNGNNKFYCDSCHSLQEAEKKMGLKKLPNVLALHLKRFKYSEESQRNVKLFNMLKYPIDFSLRGDIPNEDNQYDQKHYELYSVVVHIGGGPHHGHYVALVKTPMGWLLFDDTSVEQIDEDFVLKFVSEDKDLATAYVLFYRDTEADKDENRSSEVFNDFRFDSPNPTAKEEFEDIAPLDQSAGTPSNDLSNPALQRLKIKNNSPINHILPKKQPIRDPLHNYSQQEPPTFSSSLFWKKSRNDKDKENDREKDKEKERDKDRERDKEKEKKKNRISMSFGFKKG